MPQKAYPKFYFSAFMAGWIQCNSHYVSACEFVIECKVSNSIGFKLYKFNLHGQLNL